MPRTNNPPRRKILTEAEYEERTREKDRREAARNRERWDEEDRTRREDARERRRPNAFDGLFDDASTMTAEDVL